MKKKHDARKRRAKKPAKEKIRKNLTPWEFATNKEEEVLRLKNHLTMTQAAKRCHLSRPAISQHEHQERGMTLRTLVDIATGYGLEPEDFLKLSRQWLPKFSLLFLMLD